MRYRIALMPARFKNRPQYPMRPSSITVHNTANLNASADNHARYLSAQARAASWHITVDDVEAVLHIPLNEQAWHTGTTQGNTTSIGIEVCEFSDRARQDKADDNAQRLIADMLTGRAPVAFRTTHLTIASIRTHRSWSGKYCPRMIIPWWPTFIRGINTLMVEGDDMSYRHVAGWAETPAARTRVESACQAQEVRYTVDGPAWEFHASLAKTKLIEAVVAADPRLHRFHGVPVTTGTHNGMGVADGIGTRPWGVTVGLVLDDWKVRYEELVAKIRAALPTP